MKKNNTKLNTKVRNNNTASETILTFKINRVLLWDSAFIKTEIVCRNFVPRWFLATWGFPFLYFDLLTNEIEGKHTAQTCQTINSLRQ